MSFFQSLIATPAAFERDGIVRLPEGREAFLANPTDYRGKAFILCHFVPLQGLFVDRITPSAVLPKNLEID